MKIRDGYITKFTCNVCGLVAGADADERRALAQARKTSRAQSWVWKHPHWQLYCPGCQHLILRARSGAYSPG